MSTTINPATSQSAYQSYYTNAANASTGAVNSGVNAGWGISPTGGWQGRHGEGDFMQNLLQALQQLAVSLENLTSPTSSSSSNTPTPLPPALDTAANSQSQTGEEISITLTSSTIIDATSLTASGATADTATGSNANAGAISAESSSLEIDTSMTITIASSNIVNSGSGSDSSTNNDQGSASTPSPDIRQLFHDFMHALFQALKQPGGQQQATPGNTATASDGDSGATATTDATAQTAPSIATPVTSAAASGYGGDFSNNLTNLINALNSESNTSGSPNPADSNLQTAFNNLISALQGNSGSAPSLVDVLKQVQSNNNSSTVNPAGNAVSVSA